MHRTYTSLILGSATVLLLFLCGGVGWWMTTALAQPLPLLLPTRAVYVPLTRLPTAVPSRPATPTPPLPFGQILVTPLPTAEPTTMTGICGAPETLTFALLGVDSREADYAIASRTDAMVLVRLDLVNRTATTLAIPRDLYVPFPNADYTGASMGRINTAFLYGEVYGVPGGGPAQLADTLAWNFGIRVDHYVMVNFAAFETTVDAVGGLELDVPKAIYDDRFPAEDDASTIVFEVPAGWQHMDGRTALRYARTRHQDDDYHRIQRQQLVLMALRDKLLSPAVIPQLPTLAATMHDSVVTDLPPELLAPLLCAAPQIDRNAISSYAIDGTMVIPWTTFEGGQVGIPDREAIAPLIAAFLGQ